MPSLTRLDIALHQAGIETTPSLVKSVRARAKQINACVIVGRKFYVTEEQLTQIMETYRWRNGNGVGEGKVFTLFKHRGQAFTRLEASCSAGQFEKALARLTTKPQARSA